MQSLVRSLHDGRCIKVQAVSPAIFRLRLGTDPQFEEPSMIRYGIIRAGDDSVDAAVSETPQMLTLATQAASLSVDLATGAPTLRDSRGRILAAGDGSPYSNSRQGFAADFKIDAQEKFYGMGDITRDKMQMRGQRAHIWVRNVASYIPIPFVMSARGWALFVNSTWRHVIDIASDEGRALYGENILHFGGSRGDLDYYLIAGESLPILLDRFTSLSGRPAMLPQWAYGLTFVCNQQASAREMLDDCLSFRREGIPCDLIGLEPGWMETNYDYSIQKQWHPDRFAIPPWISSGFNPATFLGAAKRLGFKISLWLCSEYDLLYEEERRLDQGVSGSESGGPAEPHPDDFERDQHFGHGPIKSDTLTDPNEAWFTHLKKFVDQGVSAFKMDGANQVNEHPDRKWGAGLARGDMDDAEMHNLYPTLLNKQMSLGFSEHTGRRSMVYSSGGYAGIQQFAATWAGDTGGGPRPLVSLLNHGLSGHSNTSVDMDVFSPAAIHFGFLQPWAQVNSWAYWRHPWLLGKELGDVFKFYARLRYRLMPYIYSMAHAAAATGMPIMRAMPLAFPDDPRSDDLATHYMLGESLLTAAFADSMHIPEGDWYDLWTGERVTGPVDLPYSPPAGRGGPLFVRAGAIIPMAPVMNYWGEKPLTELTLHIFPAPSGRFTLWEDDGETLAYRTGEMASTRFAFESDGGGIRLTASKREGSYAGMPAERSYRAIVHGSQAPSQFTSDPAGVPWDLAPAGLGDA